MGFHRAMTDATSPITKAEQSNNMWNPSEINPRLFVHIPYANSTKVKPGKGKEFYSYTVFCNLFILLTIQYLMTKNYITIHTLLQQDNVSQ